MDFILNKNQKKQLKKVSNQFLYFFQNTVGRGTKIRDKRSESMSGSSIWESVPDMNATKWMWVILVIVIFLYFLYKMAFYMIMGVALYFAYMVWASKQ